jgi:hypothetical protein
VKDGGVLERVWAALPWALAAVTISVVVLLTCLFFRERAQASGDAAVVFCLAPARSGDIIAAAEALEVAQGVGADRVRAGGRSMDLPTWRDERPDDFGRACDALAGAQRAAGPGLFATILPFLTGLVGAAAAFFAATWRDRVARGRLLADDLRTKYGDFHRALETFLSTPAAVRQSAPVKEARAEVLTQLSRLRALHPRWRAVSWARTELAEKADLGPEATAGWTGVDRSREKDMRAALEEMQETVARVGNALEKPIRSRWYMYTYRGGRR